MLLGISTRTDRSVLLLGRHTHGHTHGPAHQPLACWSLRRHTVPSYPAARRRAAAAPGRAVFEFTAEQASRQASAPTMMAHSTWLLLAADPNLACRHAACKDSSALGRSDDKGVLQIMLDAGTLKKAANGPNYISSYTNDNLAQAVRTHIESSGGIYQSPPDPQVNYGGEPGMCQLLQLLLLRPVLLLRPRLTAHRLLAGRADEYLTGNTCASRR
eukprot:SAG31_NODE_1071_length_10069_cov_3.085356_4_plen_215_part_00